MLVIGQQSSLFMLKLRQIKFCNIGPGLTPLVQCYKTFYARNLRMSIIRQSINTLQASQAQPNIFGQTGAYQSEVPFRCSTRGQAPDLIHKLQAILEGPAIDKHSSLLRIFAIYRHKKFYNIGSRLHQHQVLNIIYTCGFLQQLIKIASYQLRLKLRLHKRRIVAKTQVRQWLLACHDHDDDYIFSNQCQSKHSHSSCIVRFWQ